LAGTRPHAGPWDQLMSRLGYTRYVAQGGDVGAAVTDAMARWPRTGWPVPHQPARDRTGRAGTPPTNPSRTNAGRWTHWRHSR
jgi:hypothetical protein